jgi:hypothetical protein
MTRVLGALREQVMSRAGGRCEYCRLNERYTIKRHETDHIYAEKHGGDTLVDNLCLSCLDCNRTKGSDLCSLDPQTGEIAALFHPRRVEWAAHFQMNGAVIEGITSQGRTTVRALRMNDLQRVEERTMLMESGLYP